MRLEYGFLSEAGDFIYTKWSDEFTFTGRTRFVDRQYQVEIEYPVKRGIFRKRIELTTRWVDPDEFRCISP